MFVLSLLVIEHQPVPLTLVSPRTSPDTAHLLGAALGALLAALLGSYLGRKTSLLAACLPDTLGWALVAATSILPSPATLPLLVTGRALTGLAAGAYLSTIQTFVAELVQTEHRGWMGGLALPIGSIGVMAMYVLGSWLSWADTALVCTLPPLLLALALAFLWDSPYSLLLRGKDKEAHLAMDQLREGDPGAMAELFAIQNYVNNHTFEGGVLTKLRFLCTQKKYYSPFFILNFLIIIILFTGITTMNLYANELFQRAGGHMDLYLSNILIGLVQLVGCCLFLPLVKAYSRKLLLVFSSLVMACSLALLGLYLYSQTRQEDFFLAVGESSWLAILCFSTFLAAAPTGLCSIPLLYTAELFPTELRSLLSGLTVLLAALGLLVARLVFPGLEAVLLPHGIVWLGAAACVVAILFTLSAIPETRHKELSQIPEKLAAWRKEARASPWVTPMPSPSHSRCTTPSRETKKFDFRSHMFTK